MSAPESLAAEFAELRSKIGRAIGCELARLVPVRLSGHRIEVNWIHIEASIPNPFHGLEDSAWEQRDALLRYFAWCANNADRIARALRLLEACEKNEEDARSWVSAAITDGNTARNGDDDTASRVLAALLVAVK